MKIGIDLTPFTKIPTGVGQYTRHLLRELVELKGEDTFSGLAASLRSLDKKAIPIHYSHIPIPSRLMYRIWARLKRPYGDTLLRGIDVFHGVNYVLPPLKRARGVLSIHDLGFLRKSEWFSPKIMKPFSRSIREDARRADRVIAVSKSTRDDIINYLGIPPEKIRVIYEAADPFFKAVAKEEAAAIVHDSLGITSPYLLFLGTVEARKNVTGLLTAFSKADIPHTLVVAGGPGWRSEEAFQLQDQLGLAERVVFTGYLRDRMLLPILYSGADAFVFPSWHEGFGLPLLEAMACNCPVIASNASSLPEIGGDAAIYVSPENTDELARKMELVTGDPRVSESLREKGAIRSREFSWKKCAQETWDCYESLK
ncbi:MAG: glycosyltransferase family 1 protein [Candidatus Hydrogenedentales bacterium]